MGAVAQIPSRRLRFPLVQFDAPTRGMREEGQDDGCNPVGYQVRSCENRDYGIYIHHPGQYTFRHSEPERSTELNPPAELGTCSYRRCQETKGTPWL